MTNKNLSSKFEELKPKVPVHLDTERKLLPRLKFMGYLMSLLGVATFAFAVFAPKDPGIGPEVAQEEILSPSTAGMTLMNDEDLLELNPMEVLNFYAVSFTFFFVGGCCFLIAWKKRKTLFQETQTNGE